MVGTKVPRGFVSPRTRIPRSLAGRGSLVLGMGPGFPLAHGDGRDHARRAVPLRPQVPLAENRRGGPQRGVVVVCMVASR